VVYNVVVVVAYSLPDVSAKFYQFFYLFKSYAVKTNGIRK